MDAKKVTLSPELVEELNEIQKYVGLPETDGENTLIAAIQFAVGDSLQRIHLRNVERSLNENEV